MERIEELKIMKEIINDMKGDCTQHHVNACNTFHCPFNTGKTKDGVYDSGCKYKTPIQRVNGINKLMKLQKNVELWKRLKRLK